MKTPPKTTVHAIWSYFDGKKFKPDTEDAVRLAATVHPRMMKVTLPSGCVQQCRRFNRGDGKERFSYRGRVVNSGRWPEKDVFFYRFTWTVEDIAKAV